MDERLSGQQVLVVEDDPAGARMLAALFLSEGASVRHAGSAEDALLALRDFRGSVLIVDLVLPTMSGLAFVQEVRRLFDDRRYVIVAISAMNGPGLERMALQTGCDAYVRKPIDLEHLVRIVMAQLKGRP